MMKLLLPLVAGAACAFHVGAPAMRGAVEWVSYAGLPTSKYHGLSKKYTPKGAGSVFTVGLRGGFEAGPFVRVPTTGQQCGRACPLVGGAAKCASAAWNQP